MAVAFQSVQTASASSTTITITKPVSLAVGDLMVAHLVATGTSAQETATVSLTGWTAISGTGQGDAGANTCTRNLPHYKIADSSDVAASNFTFTWTASMALRGAIYRITGANPTPLTVVNAAAIQDQGSSPWAPTAPVTPTE